MYEYKDLRHFFNNLKNIVSKNPEAENKQELYKGLLWLAEEVHNINKYIEKLENNKTTS